MEEYVCSWRFFTDFSYILEKVEDIALQGRNEWYRKGLQNLRVSRTVTLSRKGKNIWRRCHQCSKHIWSKLPCRLVLLQNLQVMGCGGCVSPSDRPKQCFWRMLAKHLVLSFLPLRVVPTFLNEIVLRNICQQDEKSLSPSPLTLYILLFLLIRACFY